jgi:hypothetical protein
MKRFLIFLVLAAMLLGAASGDLYPGKINTGAKVQTNAGAATNGEGLIAIETIAATETSDDDQCWTGIPANNTTNFLLRSSTPKGTPLFLAQPDVPRNIICTPSGSATGQVKITGTDIASAAITENLTLNGAGVVSGLKAFKTVTRLDGSFTQETARTLKIGTGNVLGLNTKLGFNSVLYSLVNGALEGTPATVTTSATVLSLNTIDTNSAPGGYVTKAYFVVTA